MSVVTDKLAPVRKVLAIRATAEERSAISLAAEREHRSVSSFMLRAALDAAKAEATPAMRLRTVEDIAAALRHAQELMRPFRQAGHSMVDELIAERRAEAALE